MIDLTKKELQSISGGMGWEEETQCAIADIYQDNGLVWPHIPKQPINYDYDDLNIYYD